MTRNITGVGQTFNSSGEFSSSFSGGTGSLANPFPTNGIFTINGWFKIASAPSGNKVILGAANTLWIGMNSSGQVIFNWGAGGQAISSGSYADGNWHHFEFSSGVNTYQFVDGVSLGAHSSMSGESATYSSALEIRTFLGNSAYDWPGEVDDIAIWSSPLHSATFAPPTAAVSSGAAGLIALWNFDGNLLDTAGVGVAATVLTLGLSASSGLVGSPVTITVGTNSPLTGSQTETVAVTSDLAGTITTSPVTLNAANQTRTLTFAPSTAGSATITATATGTPTISAASIGYTANASGGGPGVANSLDTSKVIVSPGNWSVGSTSLKTVNAAAYMRTKFTGTSCTLNFDMTGITDPSRFYYQIDNGPMVQATVAATVALSVPGATSDWADKGGHTLNIVFKERTNYVEVWNSPVVLFALTGITLDSGKSLVLPSDAAPVSGIVFGDSITEGQVTVSASVGDGTLSYAYALRRLLGAEIGVVGFGGQGWTVSGGGNSPAFPTTYNQIYNGVPRSFAGLDFIAINHGTNDGGNNVTTAATTTLNAILADATLSSTCKIIVLRPFNGAHAAQLIAAIAACSNPSRVFYLDTTGFFNTVNSADGLHPYGNEGVSHIAPQVASSIRTILASGASAPSGTATTVTFSVVDDNGNPVTGQAGLDYAFYDQPRMNAGQAPIKYGATLAINAGAVTFSIAGVTSLNPGDTGRVVWSNAAGTKIGGGQVVVS